MTLVFPDAEGGGGGYTPPTSFETFSQGSNYATNGDNTIWTKVGGETLLNLANPKQPTIIKAGIYALSALFILSGGILVGKAAQLTLDFANGAGTVQSEVSLGTAVVGDNPDFSLCWTAYCAAGDVIDGFIYHVEVLAQTWIFQAWLQRIT